MTPTARFALLFLLIPSVGLAQGRPGVPAVPAQPAQPAAGRPGAAQPAQPAAGRPGSGQPGAHRPGDAADRGPGGYAPGTRPGRDAKNAVNQDAPALNAKKVKPKPTLACTSNGVTLPGKKPQRLDKTIVCKVDLGPGTGAGLYRVKVAAVVGKVTGRVSDVIAQPGDRATVEVKFEPNIDYKSCESFAIHAEAKEDAPKAKVLWKKKLEIKQKCEDVKKGDSAAKVKAEATQPKSKGGRPGADAAPAPGGRPGAAAPGGRPASAPASTGGRPGK
jgi:hypothetical protein